MGFESENMAFHALDTVYSVFLAEQGRSEPSPTPPPPKKRKKWLQCNRIAAAGMQVTAVAKFSFFSLTEIATGQNHGGLAHPPIRFPFALD